MNASVKTASQTNPTTRSPIRKSISGTGVTLEGIEIAYNAAHVEYNRFHDDADRHLSEGGEFTDEMYAEAMNLAERLGTLCRAMKAVREVLESL